MTKLSTPVLDCQSCGACCAAYVVTMHWIEALERGIHPELTEKLDCHRVCLTGTSGSKPKCNCLEGKVGENVTCAIYHSRPDPCRDLTAGSEQCLRARQKYGLIT